MTSFESFARELRLATEGFSREAMSAELAKFAKQEVARAISSGEAPAHYTRYVNGREGVPEEAVEAPGPILYVFSNWKLVIEAALQELIDASPRQSGNFRKSFIVIVGGRSVTSFEGIPPEAEVIITNAQPYVRKMQVGFGGLSVKLPPRPFDVARRKIVSRFGSGFIAAEVRFLNIGSGIHPLIPYELKNAGGNDSRRGPRLSSRTRRDRSGKLTYPSLILNMVD